jgi:nitroreductase
MREKLMTKTQDVLKRLGNVKGVIDSIYKRHSVRDYSAELVSEANIHALLYAAIQAPSAMHQEPWAFAVIQDKKMLKRISKAAKQYALSEMDETVSKEAKEIQGMASKPDFNIFYNAGTLIVIYGKPLGEFAEADCWLAAQNLMLAAYGSNLGSCVIGLSVPVLNSLAWKTELQIPEEMTAYAPIIVGHLAEETSKTSRNPPEVLCWLKPE